MPSQFGKQLDKRQAIARPAAVAKKGGVDKYLSGGHEYVAGGAPRKQASGKLARSPKAKRPQHAGGVAHAVATGGAKVAIGGRVGAVSEFGG